MLHAFVAFRGIGQTDPPRLASLVTLLERWLCPKSQGLEQVLHSSQGLTSQSMDSPQTLGSLESITKDLWPTSTLPTMTLLGSSLILAVAPALVLYTCHPSDKEDSYWKISPRSGRRRWALASNTPQLISEQLSSEQPGKSCLGSLQSTLPGQS